ncbi:Homocysteine S-methyltransferase [Melampsora americana]|nr:Homocysteine S-methyltransferase [Melampsora americana]
MSMSDLFPNQKIVLLDGGNGTSLADDSANELDTALWSATLLVKHPERIARLHHLWEQAGADIITTCSYQATVQAFENYLGRQAPWAENEEGKPSNEPNENGSLPNRLHSPLDFLRSSIGVAHGSVSTAKLGLSLGPYGATLTPPQDYAGVYPSPYDQLEPLKKFHLDRLLDYAQDEVTWRKVDLVVFETIPNLLETLAVRSAWSTLLKLLENRYERSEGVKWWVKPWVLSFVFAGSTGQFASGASPTEVFDAAFGLKKDPEQILLPRPSAVGVNCTKLQFIDQIISAWTHSSESQSSPPWLWMYPDGGLVYDVDRRCWSGGQIGTDEWARQLMKIAKSASLHWPGVVAGGCCKTGPAHIRALKEIRDRSR